MKNVHYLQDDYTTVEAVFVGGFCPSVLITPAKFYEDNKNNTHHRYTFKADIALGLQVNDLAVVHVKSGFAVVQIVAVHDAPTLDPNASFEYKWVVDKINLEGFVARLQEEIQLKQKLAQLAYFEKSAKLKARLQVMEEGL